MVLQRKQLTIKRLGLFILLIAIVFLSRISVFAQNQQVIVEPSENNDQNLSSPRLETGSVTPQYGPPGEYTFHTYFSDPQNRTPEYVKIYITDTNKDVLIEETQPYLMRGTSNITSRGVRYDYTTNISQEGQYQFYFEAKIGSTILHNPYYGGQDCRPGLCPECCGAWGGPKILSEELIDDHKIYLFDQDKEQPVWSYDVGKNWVTSVAFSKDNMKFAAADNQGNLYLFDVGSNIPIWTYGIASNIGQNNEIKIGISSDKGLIAFSDNGYIVASLGKQVFLFQTDSNEPIWQYDIGMAFNGLVISDDGKYIAAGGHDTKVYLWETQNSNPKWEYKVKSEGGILGLEGSVIRAMAMTPDGKYFVAGTSCPDRSVYAFTPGKSEPILKIQAGSNFPIETIDISDDGQYIITAGGGSSDDPYSALLIKTNQEEPIWKFDYSKNPAITARISPDSQSIALGYILDGVYLLQRDSNQPLWQLKNSGYVGDMAFSTEGKILAIGTGTYHVILVSLDNFEILRDWKVENKVESVAVSPNGKYIVAGTSLNRFLSIGTEGDNTTGAGIGELKDLKPELVKLSTNIPKFQTNGNIIKDFKIPNFCFWIGLFLGVGLLILGLIIFFKKRTRWIIVIATVGIGLIIVSCYYIVINKKQASTNGLQKDIQNQNPGDQNIQIEGFNDTNNSN